MSSRTAIAFSTTKSRIRATLNLSTREDSSNKDHQRMMVDPMIMIVLSLRSFLTAVTPTAVTLIAVILPEFT